MTSAALVYHDVPAEVSRITAYQWQPGGPVVPLVAPVLKSGAETTVTFVVSATVIVMFGRGDGSYVLDGPVTLSDAIVERTLDHVWRRTVTGSAPLGLASTPAIEWLSADGTTSLAWPACRWSTGGQWDCLGVPLDAGGVALAPYGSRVLSAVVTGETTPVLKATVWGRLIVVSDRDGPGIPRLRFTAARASPPPQRARSVRLETTPLADVHAAILASGVAWLSGDASPPDAWIEIRSARSGPEYAALADVVQGPSSLAMRLTLDDRRDVIASVTTRRGDPAPGALVSVFRLIDPPQPSPAPGQPPPRRVLAAEAIAEADGTVVLDGLGGADYEIVAWHAQLGRNAVRLERTADRVAIRLQPPGVARGRVLSAGRPATGVDVISVPDPAAYAAAEDPIDLKGGDTRTGADGRFAVALASGGGGELRVGGGSYAVTRVPLPRAPLPVVDLGDIELARGLTLSVTLDQDPGCDLRAAGPIGRSGLHIVTATRAGPGLFSIVLPEEGSWEVGLLCGRDERSLAPAVIRVTSDGPRQVTLAVR
jgi:hypothetical protein